MPKMIRPNQSKRTRRLIIGVTGGIASGKSTVMAEISRLGVPTLSSDDVARRALRPGTRATRAVLRHFGNRVASARGTINRTALGDIIFQSMSDRRWLERLVHPIVVKEIQSFIRKQRGLAAVDIPLLFESNLSRLVDRVVVVAATRPQQVLRLRKRTPMSLNDASFRIRAQWPLSRKAKLADFILDNRGTLSQLKTRVRRLLRDVKRSST